LTNAYSFGIVYDERFLLHDTGIIRAVLPDGTDLDAIDHPSSARITRRIHDLLTRSGLARHLTPIGAREATIEEVAAFHTHAYIARLEQLSAAGEGEAGDSAPVGPGSFQVALLAAGGCVEAVSAVLSGAVRGAYVLARPPGHHAVARMGMGYCLFNNIAIAALYARGQGVERIMILDWDVHHGNGTQEAFYADPSLLFLSLHQENWYPLGMGMLDQMGEGHGVGFTVNVPLPPGTGDRGYLEVMDHIVEPVARRFNPDLLMVSAGQDASMLDPLGRMLVTMGGYRALGRRTRALADDLCGGRLVVVQEGGYSEAYTPFCTLAALEGLTGIETEAPDPYADTSEIARAQTILTPDTQAALAAAVEAHQRWISA
jgi:acetoin utilization deacetylase AcuC-like enzyme